MTRIEYWGIGIGRLGRREAGVLGAGKELVWACNGKEQSVELECNLSIIRIFYILRPSIFPYPMFHGHISAPDIQHSKFANVAIHPLHAKGPLTRRYNPPTISDVPDAGAQV